MSKVQYGDGIEYSTTKPQVASRLSSLFVLSGVSCTVGMRNLRPGGSHTAAAVYCTALRPLTLNLISCVRSSTFSHCRYIRLHTGYRIEKLCDVICAMCLCQVSQVVAMPPHHFPAGSSLTTLRLCSDGTYLYWVWSPVSLNEKTQKGHSVFMDVFQLKVLTQNLILSLAGMAGRFILSCP